MRGREGHRGHATSGSLYAVLANAWTGPYPLWGCSWGEIGSGTEAPGLATQPSGDLEGQLAESGGENTD